MPYHQTFAKINPFHREGEGVWGWGLNTGLNWYDYGWRMYDPQLARFHTLDPRSQTYSFQSPYVYAANGPIKFVDFNGEFPLILAIPATVKAAAAATAVVTTIYVNYRIQGTNNRPNPLEGTSTSRGNPTNNGGNGKNDFFNFENVDVAIATTLGLIYGAYASSTDDKSILQTEEVAKSEMDEVCGIHLEKTDPDYWNNGLDDKQRDGYNKNRNQQWQNHLLKLTEEQSNKKENTDNSR